MMMLFVCLYLAVSYALGFILIPSKVLDVQGMCHTQIELVAAIAIGFLMSPVFLPFWIHDLVTNRA